MPGSSLWLLPPTSDLLNGSLTSLIKRTSAHFGSSDLFIPHVTLTSEISASTYTSNAQGWLDSLELPTGDHVLVDFERLASEDVYVRKLYIKCKKSAGLKSLAKACRKQVADYSDEGRARKWADEVYNPHVSLL
jgi:2',3'-cyclic-nucleotide 3'-phosphodiesterase